MVRLICIKESDVLGHGERVTFESERLTEVRILDSVKIRTGELVKNSSHTSL
jgi:hypothetical protein